MPDNDEKAKNELSAKDIKDYLGLACLRKIPVELIYNNNRYQCSYNKAEADNIILDFITADDVNKFSVETKKVTATFVFENKRYMFPSNIKLDHQVLKMDYPEVMRPIEARRFFRVEPRVEEPIPLMIAKPGTIEIFEARVEDISAGGLRFFSQSGEFAPDEKLVVAFFLTVDGTPHRIITDAITKHVRRVRLTARSHCGIQFLDISKEKREILVRFVSERQIEERKRAEGLLTPRLKSKYGAGKEIAIKNELRDSLLQLIKERDPQIAEEIYEDEGIQSDRKKILVIDDDDQSADSLRELLGEKYRLSFDASGLDGINKALNFLPDIIFLELDLKGLDGYKVCQILKTKQQTKNIPIIIFSKRNTREDVVKALSMGAVSYIVKPFDSEDILKRLEDLFALNNKGDV